jgi:hypothetical protein
MANGRWQMANRPDLIARLLIKSREEEEDLRHGAHSFGATTDEGRETELATRNKGETPGKTAKQPLDQRLCVCVET